MRIEKLSKGRKKKVILVITILVLLIGIIYITNSKAKYHVTSNIQIVKGKVSYSLADFNLMAIYLQESDGSDGGLEGHYEKAPNGQIPAEGYTLRALGDGNYDSYCVVDGIKNNNGITIEYKDGGVNFTGIKKQGTKCYLYFDVGSSDPVDKTLAALKLNTLGTIGKITGPSCNGNKNESCYTSGSPDNKKNNMAENGVYDTVDDYGKTYVFRGFIQNNWVKFGKKDNDDIWWRIIRINGNGTIRLIYAGTGASAPATYTNATQIGTKAFNSTYSDNRYVGFMYNTNSNSSQEDLGSTLSNSTIKGELDTWWGQTTLGNSGNKERIDVDTGFCNDRSLSPVAHRSYQGPGGGAGTTQTAYAPAHRVLQSGGTSWDTTEQEPTLKCANPKRDLFTGPGAAAGGIQGATSKIEGNNKLTNPVGLITMDEVIYAGGFAGQNNDGYWLYTKQNYWTMSPFCAHGSGDAGVFLVNSDGDLGDNFVNLTYGVRPVINLKADTEIDFQDPGGAGTGTTSNPYIVQ